MGEEKKGKEPDKQEREAKNDAIFCSTRGLWSMMTHREGGEEQWNMHHGKRVGLVVYCELI